MIAQSIPMCLFSLKLEQKVKQNAKKNLIFFFSDRIIANKLSFNNSQNNSQIRSVIAPFWLQYKSSHFKIKGIMLALMFAFFLWSQMRICFIFFAKNLNGVFRFLKFHLYLSNNFNCSISVHQLGGHLLPKLQAFFQLYFFS